MNIAWRRAFGYHLSQLRSRAGLTVEAAAAMAGLKNHSAWSHWEAGRNMPQPDRWPLLAEVLKLKDVRLLVPSFKIKD